MNRLSERTGGCPCPASDSGLRKRFSRSRIKAKDPTFAKDREQKPLGRYAERVPDHHQVVVDRKPIDSKLKSTER